MLSQVFEHFTLNHTHSFCSQQYFLPIYDSTTDKYVFVFSFSPLNQNLKQSSKYKVKKNWFEEELQEFATKSDSLLLENSSYVTHPKGICIELFSNKLEKYNLYCQQLFLVVKSESIFQEQTQSIEVLHKQVTQFIQNKQYLLPITHFLPKNIDNLEYSASIACGVKYIYLNDGKLYKFCYEGSGWVNMPFRKQLIQKYAGYMQIKKYEQFIKCEFMEGAVHANNIRSFKSIQQVGTIPWKNLHSCDLAFYLKKNLMKHVFEKEYFQPVKKITHFYHFQNLILEAYERGNLLSADLSRLFYYSKFFGCFTNQEETFGMIILKNDQEQYIIHNIFYTGLFSAEEKIYQFESLLQTILFKYILQEKQITLLLTTNEASPIYWHWKQKLIHLDSVFCCSESKWIKVITPLSNTTMNDLPIELSDKLWNDFREIHNGPMNQSNKISKL